jgi:hypothetical protein
MLLITLLDDDEAKPPIIVAYLRKRNVVLSHSYNSANVIEPREPHICNSIKEITHLSRKLTLEPNILVIHNKTHSILCAAIRGLLLIDCRNTEMA